jgi:hypothetical protein
MTARVLRLATLAQTLVDGARVGAGDAGPQPGLDC